MRILKTCLAIVLLLAVCCASACSISDIFGKKEDPQTKKVITSTKHYVTFMADDVQVAKLEYKDKNSTIEVPAVPEKVGYTGEWEEYTLDGKNKTVNAVYTAIEYKISYMYKSPIDASEKEMNMTLFLGLKTTYTIEDSIISIPLENNDTFSVWWLNDEPESTKTNEPIVLKGRTGDLVVHCRWS